MNKPLCLCALLLVALATGPAEAVNCNRNNNTVAKLTQCVTLDGVRAHQAAFQAIADANGGTRAAGSTGYDDSVSYVINQLDATGSYNVTIDPATGNVIAETVTGREDNVIMVGAHLDSVPTGPGIQDNGSGSAAVLEIALQMKNVNPANKVRFAWWGGEEAGLIGSLNYLISLSAQELDDIALYLNFDMIGSPNFVRFVYDGDGSALGSPGPQGSGAIESAFAGYYSSLGLPFEPTAFGITGFTASTVFAAFDIPVGGIFTGAEVVKTEEQAAIYGGTAGDQYDPCWHLACDTFDNISLEALDQNSDAAAAVILQFAGDTESVNGIRGRSPRRRGPDIVGEPE